MVNGNCKILKSNDMFLKLNHQRLEVYQASKIFVLECYKLTKNMPVDEKFGMISQIRRAAVSVHLNIAEGSSRKSEIERERFYEVARGSIIEIDATLDIAIELNYFQDMHLNSLGESMVKTFKF
jgi:four helix bundle protein